jgi:hypothetical protein
MIKSSGRDKRVGDKQQVATAPQRQAGLGAGELSAEQLAAVTGGIVCRKAGGDPG